MKTLKLLLTVLTFVTLIALQNSNAQAIQEIKVKPFSVHYSDCLGEGGFGSITFHHVYINNKANNLQILHSNIIDGWFIGTQSGTLYKVIETRRYSLQNHKNNLQETTKFQIAFMIVSTKNKNSSHGYANLQFTKNAHGKLTVERWEINLCFDPLIEE